MVILMAVAAEEEILEEVRHQRNLYGTAVAEQSCSRPATIAAG